GGPRGDAAGTRGEQQRGGVRMTLELVRTPAVRAGVAAHRLRPRLVLGFAAETEDLVASARATLAANRVDLVAANRVGVPGSGFESETNALTVVGEGFERALGPAPKAALADTLVELIAERIAGRS